MFHLYRYELRNFFLRLSTCVSMTSTSTSLCLLLVAIMFYSVIQKTQNISIKANSEYFEVHRACLLFIESGLGRLVRMKKGNAPGWQPRSLRRKGLYTYICCLVHAIIDPNLDRVAFSAADKGSTKIPSLWPLKTLFLSSRFSKCANSPLSGSYEGRKESNATGYQVTNR